MAIRCRGCRAGPNGTTLLLVEVGNYAVLDAWLACKVTSAVTLTLSVLQFNAPHLLQAAAPPVERRVFLSVSARL